MRGGCKRFVSISFRHQLLPLVEVCLTLLHSRQSLFYHPEAGLIMLLGYIRVSFPVCDIFNSSSPTHADFYDQSAGGKTKHSYSQWTSHSTLFSVLF